MKKRSRIRQRGRKKAIKEGRLLKKNERTSPTRKRKSAGMRKILDNTVRNIANLLDR